MQTSERVRIFRSAGMAIAALLLIGGAVFGSQSLTGNSQGSHDAAGASADTSPDVQGNDASQNETESPEASPDENGADLQDAFETESESPDASPDEDASETPEASPDESDDDSSGSDDSGSSSPSESPVESGSGSDGSDGGSGGDGSGRD